MKNQTDQLNENTYTHRRNFVKNGLVIRSQALVY